MFERNQKKLLVCALMTALLLSVAAVSTAHAASDEPTLPPSEDSSTAKSEDEATLYMTQDGNVTDPDASGDDPTLYQAQDDGATTQDDNATLYTIQENGERSSEENQLYAGQASPDYTAYIIGCAALLAIVAVAVLVVVRRRKAN